MNLAVSTLDPAPFDARPCSFMVNLMLLRHGPGNQAADHLVAAAESAVPA